MEIGKQIKKYRTSLGMSQEMLAERIFVSRQTISNWENDKNYPDIKSLLMLSSLFEISLDQLIKGDLEEMKKQINQSDVRKFNHISALLAVCMLIMIISPIPLVKGFGTVGGIIWLIIAAVTLAVAITAERYKKEFDIQSYREIVAFTENKTLSSQQEIEEKAKRPYQKILLAIASGAIALIVTALMMLLFK